jgi:hypothetical protein
VANFSALMPRGAAYVGSTLFMLGEQGAPESGTDLASQMTNQASTWPCLGGH